MSRAAPPVTRSASRRARLVEFQEESQPLQREAVELYAPQATRPQLRKLHSSTWGLIAFLTRNIALWLHPACDIPLPSVEHMYRRLYIGVFLPSTGSRQAMLLVTSHEIPNTNIDRIVQHGILYYPSLSPDKKSQIGRRLPLAVTGDDFKNYLPLHLISLGHIRKEYRELHLFETLTSRLDEDLLLSPTFEMDWVWNAVKVRCFVTVAVRNGPTKVRTDPYGECPHRT